VVKPAAYREEHDQVAFVDAALGYGVASPRGWWPAVVLP